MILSWDDLKIHNNPSIWVRLDDPVFREQNNIIQCLIYFVIFVWTLQYYKFDFCHLHTGFGSYDEWIIFFGWTKQIVPL